MRSGRVFVGTSGYDYPGWRGRFYPRELPRRKWLAYASARFDSIELNGTFYSLKSPDVFRRWVAETPRAGFVFAVKGSRFITHNKKLSDPQSALDKFFPRVAALGGKLGVILFQLPPQWRVNAERLESFLQALPKGHRYTFEMRNLDEMSAWDEVKFVLSTRRDYEFARDFTAQHGLARRVKQVLLSPVFADPQGKWPGLEPRLLVEWILADGLPVRLGLQLHKFIWDPTTKGV